MSTYLVEQLNGEPWLFEDTGEHTCAGGLEHGHERHCGIEPVASIASLLSQPAGGLVLSAEAFDELATREPSGPNPAMVELFRQTRGSVIHTDRKSARIRELEHELDKRTGSLEMLVEAHRVLRAERDELAAAVARVDDKIGTLMMDRENWRAASELQELLSGEDPTWKRSW